MQAKALDDELVMNLVELALARPLEERPDYLRSVCGPDTELLTQVQNYVHWEERMNGFLLDPLYPPLSDEHPFEAGQVLDNRFRIVREVAEGGMGVVYEAVDEKLERRIAIKCAKAGFRKRLPPEVRNASEVSHPNVCKIFEIHTASTDHGEIDFLTMEFLEGETLADKLRRGPLPEIKARAIARQLAEGLAAAHRNRVIHGDLKSSNVILTTGADGTTRAVITDFGLARRPEAAQRSAQSSGLAGTPDYMAPELWKGQKASIASDLYALGVILYELASSHRPYGPEVRWEERLTRKPPSVHPQWDRILTRCLDPDPARRLRDAEEVARAFDPSYIRRRWLAAVAAIILATVTGAVTYQRATAPKESVRLAMLPFETDQSTAKLADGLWRDTGGQLARLKGSARTKLTVVPAADILRKRADTIDKMRTLLGATHVLHATLSQQSGKIVVHAYLTDAVSGIGAKDWTPEYAPGELRYTPVALAGFVTETLKLPPLAVEVTVNAAAKEDYWKGLYYWRRNSGADTALVFLERAAIADPDSPLTHAALAEAQWLKYNVLTKDRLWRERAAESEREAEARNPDLPQVHRVAGLLQYDAGRYELAAAEYLRAIELDPKNSDAYRRLGMDYEANNQLDEALAAYRQAVAADPQNYRNHQQLGSFYYRLSNYTEAALHFRQAITLAPDEPDAHFALGTADMSAGRLGEAERDFRFAVSLKETPNALNGLAFALMNQAKDREAIPYIKRALELAPDRFLWWEYLGIASRRANLTAQSEHANHRGLELAETEMRNNPRNGYTRSHLAYLCALLGDRRRAESEIAQALQLSPNDADVRWQAVITYEALGNRKGTLDLLSSSPNEVIAELSRWPDLADLHRDSRFLQLLAARQIK